MAPLEIYPSLIPFYAIIVSLAAVPLILLSSRHPNIRDFWTVAASIIKFALVFLLLPGALTNRIAECTLWEVSPGIGLALKADPLGVLFALIASGLWILTSVYSIGYVRGLDEQKQTRYFASFAVCLSATLRSSPSANILAFAIMIVCMAFLIHPLVIHKETK